MSEVLGIFECHGERSRTMTERLSHSPHPSTPTGLCPLRMTTFTALKDMLMRNSQDVWRPQVEENS